MQILSRLSTVAALVSAIAAQGVYVSPGTASYLPGTFGQTFSDGSYISAGVPHFPGNFNPYTGAKGGEYDDISYASQTGGPAANVNLQGPYGYGPQGPPPFPPQYNSYGQQAPLGPPPPPIYSAGTGGLSPPPPPIYSAGVGVSDGNIPPAVTVGYDTHTVSKAHKRDTESTESTESESEAEYYPYGYGYEYPRVTIGAPTAYYAPGTFGQTWADGSYVTAGVPHFPYKKHNKRQVVSAQAYPYGPTVSVGAPPAKYLPGTFGTTFNDGGYTSWGVPDYAQIAAMQAQYGGYAPYPFKQRDVSTPVDGSNYGSTPGHIGYTTYTYHKTAANSPSAEFCGHRNGYIQNDCKSYQNNPY